MKQPGKQQPFTVLPLTQKAEVITLVHILSQEYSDCCLHLEAWKQGIVVCCSAEAGDTCIGCGRPTCEKHWSQKTLTVEDREGHGAFLLCQVCAILSREDLDALRAVRLAMNGW